MTYLLNQIGLQIELWWCVFVELSSKSCLIWVFLLWWGSGRTGLVIACYLVYTNQCKGAQEVHTNNDLT